MHVILLSFLSKEKKNVKAINSAGYFIGGSAGSASKPKNASGGSKSKPKNVQSVPDRFWRRGYKPVLLCVPVFNDYLNYNTTCVCVPSA